MEKIYFQGTFGAYSHLAALSVAPKAKIIPCKTFDECFLKASEDSSSRIIIPESNRITGNIGIEYLVFKYRLNIYSEYFQKIEHNLLVIPGTKISDIKNVYSHSQALSQCSNFIKSNNLIEHVRADTAGSAEMISRIKDNKNAAIASTLSAETYGLEIIKRNIENEKGNLTRFLIMCKNMEFDTVYHEHINFFNVNSMDKLLKRVNLKLHYVTKKPIHGSSYLFVIKFKSNQKRIEKIAKDEKFLRYKYYKKWGINCSKSVRKIKTKIDNLQKTKIVVGYGAAAKANTFINFSRVKFDFIIDDNKFKQNKFCPGSKIPIKSINALNKIKQNIVVVPLAWNFYSEIKSKVIKLRKNKKDKFLVCFPKLKLDKVLS